jgi:hypothetical protein
MTPGEFCQLPPAIALRLLLDVIAHVSPAILDDIARMEAPRAPRTPRFDFRIRRKGGYAWASETDLDGLRFWRNKYHESAMSGSQWAEKDAKNADKLEYWITWRECFPKDAWQGQRNDEQVTAAVPSHKPHIYEWEPRAETPAPKGDAYEEEGGNADFPAGW